MARPKSSKAAETSQPIDQENSIQFQPIEKTTIPGEIVDQVLSMLLAGKLKAGDKLPPERHLCESLNVGRSSVREALTALETLGIIRRDIRGTTVCSPEENRYPGLSLSATTAPLEQLFETARIAGIEAAGLAAERANPENIAKMKRVLPKNVTEETENTQAAAAVHLSFHRALVNATQNPVLSQMYQMLVALISRSLGLSSATEELEEDERKAFLTEIFDGHRKILSAIKSGDSATARDAMHKHYDCMEAITPRVQAKTP
jgi:GntR family transcriptional repressor for pyruvate dehydrogenase complex